MALAASRLAGVVHSSQRAGPSSARCAAAAPVRRAVPGRAAAQEAHLRLSSVHSQHQGTGLRQKQAVRTVRCRQAAQVAKSVGKTLKSFQPTINELQSVSREFQNALKEEIYSEDTKTGVNPPTLQAANPPAAATGAPLAPEAPAAEAKTVPPMLTADAPKQQPAAGEGSTTTPTPPKQ